MNQSESQEFNKMVDAKIKRYEAKFNFSVYDKRYVKRSDLLLPRVLDLEEEVKMLKSRLLTLEQQLLAVVDRFTIFKQNE